mgnify:CR=1 FL=1
MTIVSEIDSSRRLIVTRVWGRMDLSELQERQALLPDQSGFDSTYDHLFDMSGVTAVEDLGTSALKRLASVRIFSESSRRAVVASGDLEYGMARMYEVFSGSTEKNYAVFRTIDEALEWLAKA